MFCVSFKRTCFKYVTLKILLMSDRRCRGSAALTPVILWACCTSIHVSWRNMSQMVWCYLYIWHIEADTDDTRQNSIFYNENTSHHSSKLHGNLSLTDQNKTSAMVFIMAWCRTGKSNYQDKWYIMQMLLGLNELTIYMFCTETTGNWSSDVSGMLQF